jgi:2-polyprenyl-3-methyl-5-hydroxy-6-metoxy-1,4-benzoquinol methylase
MEGHVDDKLRREAEFWENFDLNSLQYGTPYWVDVQKAEYLNTPKRYIWCDPKIEAILYGAVKAILFAALPKEGVRILDVGCGAGWLALELARLGHRVTGIDIAEKRIEIARDAAAREGVSINYQAIPLEELEVQEPFDVIVSYGSLHHFPNVTEAVAKISDLLKDDGSFLLLENSGNLIRDGVNWCRKTILKRDEDSRSPYEDISTKTLVAAVKDRFRIERETYDLAFSKILAEVFDFACPKLPPHYSYPLLRGGRVLDRWAAAIGAPQGEIVFMQARKK